MSTEDIYNMLKTVVTLFNQVSEAGTPLPYGVLSFSETNNSRADNINYCINPEARLELYTLYKDYALMAQVENLLNAAKLPWSHDTDYISSQHTFMEIYTFNTVAGALEPLPGV